MQRAVVRPLARRTGEVAACALLGFGAGLAAGFLMSEAFGTGGPRRMGRELRRRLRAGAPAPARLGALARVRAALDADPALRGESIEVRARGRGLELRGWLPSRSARSLAYRAARLAAESLELTNHLLVRGEDDLGRSGGKSDGRSDPSPLPSDSPRSA